jgi:hypothetical protein
MLQNKINNYQLVKIIVLFRRRIKPQMTVVGHVVSCNSS